MGNNVTTLTRTLICDILYCQVNLQLCGYLLHPEDKSKWFKKVCETACKVFNLSWDNNCFLDNLEKLEDTVLFYRSYYTNDLYKDLYY